MQIRKIYQEINPELLYNEVKDFTQKQGAVIAESRMETYSSVNDSSSFVSRGTLVFKSQDKSGKTGGECLRAHIVGSAKEETRLMIDIDEKLFTKPKISALQADLDFIFGSSEVNPG